MAKVHQRIINEKFMEDLSDKTFLAPLVQLVQENRDDLVMAFRKDYLNVYYKGHSLYKVEQYKSNNGYKVSFDLNHARYSADHVKCLKALLGLGMHLPDDRKEVQADYENSDGKVRSRNNTMTIKLSQGERHPTFWMESYPLLKNLIDDFFDETKSHDYFKEKGGLLPKRKKQKNLEKERQQSIMLANRATEGGYFVYDIEYAEPTKKTEQKSGRYDMMCLRLEGHIAKELVLIELKTTESACKGKSDIKKHKADMIKYLQNHELVEARRTEARAAVETLCKLNLADNIIFEETPIPVKFAFLFTDEAESFIKGPQDYTFARLEESWGIKEFISPTEPPSPPLV